MNGSLQSHRLKLRGDIGRIKSHRKTQLGFCCDLVVSVLTFYSNDSSSNLAEAADNLLKYGPSRFLFNLFFGIFSN